MISLSASLVSLVFALLATSIGQMLFKLYYVRAQRVYLAAALGTFLAVPVFSYLALLNLTLAFVYMSTALTHVMVLILSRLFLRDLITGRQYISIALIISGITIFNL